jgi:hypothetical protein
MNSGNAKASPRVAPAGNGDNYIQQLQKNLRAYTKELVSLEAKYEGGEISPSKTTQVKLRIKHLEQL